MAHRFWYWGAAVLLAAVIADQFLPAGHSSLWATMSAGPCQEEKVQRRGKQAFVRHLDKACTAEEREARAIQADDVLRALKKGHDVELSRVIVIGDLYLDTLSIKTLDQLPSSLSRDDRQVVESLGVPTVRLIAGALSIRDSEVRGRILNRVKDDRLVISGPVILSGTRFQEAVDLSRAIFLGVVDCSAASFIKEAYFVQARFQQPALFTQTLFGPHTRFHRSVFHGAANFYHARFNGLAEFLEVSFEQGAGFTGAHFLSGTGFSGSRFGSIGDFVEARFQSDVYFLFTRFEHEARFRDAVFRAAADFSDAVFVDGQDLSQATFLKPPRVPEAGTDETSPPAASPTWIAQYGVTVGFLLMAFLLLGYLLKMK